jgi:hypothetical protein
MQNLIKNKWVLLAGLFFLMVKLLWVITPTGIMGTPRLGDDALAYISLGDRTVWSSTQDSPVIQNILKIRNNEDVLTNELEFVRSRVTMRTAGTFASPSAFLMKGLQFFGLDHKILFAVFEVLIASALTFAITYSLLKIAGREAATFVLFVCALMIFPNQGLHFLIPSVFVLSLALVQFSLVLQENGFKPLALVLITLIMLLTHPIGQVYTLFSLCISIAKFFIFNAYVKRSFNAPFYLFVAALLWILIKELTGEVAPATTGMGGVSFSSLLINLYGFIRIIMRFVTNQPIFALCIFFGLINAWLTRKKMESLFIVTFGLLALMFVSLLVDLPGYPAELATRIFVPFSLFAIASFAVGTLSFSWPYILYLSGLIMVFMMAPHFYNLGMSNMNGRAEIYDSRKLNKEIANLPSGAPIIWMESDNALMAGLIEGGYKHPAIPFNMLAKSEDIFNYIDRGQPIYLATMAPSSLNGIAAKNIYSFTERFYGYGYSEYSSVSLDIANYDELYVRLRIANIDEINVYTDDGKSCSIGKLKDFRDWYVVDGCKNSKFINFSGNAKQAAFIGVSLEFPDEKRSWPWGSDLKMNAIPINKTEPVTVIFSYDYLFQSKLYPAFAQQLEKISFISDESGIIWMKTFAKPINNN